MRNLNHTKFILTPIFEILQDCVIATKGIRDGMESFPLCEYIMQTTFLKLTGASEQKLKCILWEIATNDYDFRYSYLKSQHYGECSSLDAKRNVFKDLQHQIQSINSDDNYFKEIFNNNVKYQIKNKITYDLKQLLLNSVLASWQEKEFLFFENNINSFFSEKSFCNYNKSKGNSNTISLLEKNIDYERLVYKHRNRCAHNLLSYQANLPEFSVLSNQNYDYENYFFRFSILVLLDEIFIRIYSTYLDCLAKN